MLFIPLIGVLVYLIGVLVYLIARSGLMHERAAPQVSSRTRKRTDISGRRGGVTSKHGGPAGEAG